MKIEVYLQQTLLFKIVRSGTLVTERLSEDFQPARVNYMQALILIAVSREKSPVRPKDLQKVFGFSSGAVSQGITHLVRAKYLERKISPQDARGYQLTLTQQGRSQANRLIGFIESIERRIEKAVGEKGISDCLKTLTAVYDVVGLD